ncbi:DUF3419 family protein [Lentisphaerota bacterium WC36G]|nr:BtaA family protein [Lentisphaerae bacterium WC36]
MKFNFGGFIFRIEKRTSFEFIRYANCWEDADILFKALEPKAGKRILSIASAGDNSLALLAGGAEVFALDLNKTQLACTELRKVAIKNLDYEECLCFLGFKECQKRIGIYKKLESSLSKTTKIFWNSNLKIIENGLIYTGKFEKYFQFFRKHIISLIHSKTRIQRLLQPKNYEQRVEFYEKEWNNFRWRLLFKVFFSRFVMGRMGRDPEFFRYVDVPVAENILNRTKFALTELTTDDNPYLDFILTGGFQNNLPFYMREENFSKIKANIDNLTLIHGAIDSLPSNYESSFDGFNLSDIFEYMPKEQFLTTYQTILKYASSNSKIAYWNMLVPRSCPEELANSVKLNEELSENLFKQDKAWFYSRFIVEETL